MNQLIVDAVIKYKETNDQYKDEVLVVCLSFAKLKIVFEDLMVSKTVFILLGNFFINRRFQLLRSIGSGKIPFTALKDDLDSLKKFYLTHDLCKELDYVLSLSNTVPSELVLLAIQKKKLFSLNNLIKRQRGCKKFKALREIAFQACKTGDQDLLAIFLNNGGKLDDNYYILAVEKNQHQLLDTLLALIPYSGTVCLWKTLDQSRPQECMQIFNSEINNSFSDEYNATEEVLNRHDVNCTCHEESKIRLFQ